MDASWRLAFLFLSLLALTNGYQDDITVSRYRATFDFEDGPSPGGKDPTEFGVLVEIDFRTKEYDVPSLTLNAEDLKCKGFTLYSNKSLIGSLAVSSTKTELTVFFNSTYIRKTWDYTISMSCIGKFQTNGMGLFWDKTNNPPMIIGNFYPSNTRKIFPSFDEPNYEVDVEFKISSTNIKTWCLLANGRNPSSKNDATVFQKVQVRHLNLVFYTAKCPGNSKLSREYYLADYSTTPWVLVDNLNTNFVVARNQGLIKKSAFTNDVKREAGCKYSLMNSINIKEWNDLWIEETLCKYWTFKGSDEATKSSLIEEALRYSVGKKLTSIMPKDLTDVTFVQYQNSVGPIRGFQFLRMIDKIGELLTKNKETITKMMEDIVANNAKIEGTAGFLKTLSSTVGTFMDVNLDKFFKDWLSSPSVPYVSVDKESTITITKKPFGASSDVCWDVPLFDSKTVTEEGLIWLNESCEEDHKIRSVPIYRKVLFDENFDGLYRVNYDPRTWEELGEDISEGKSWSSKLLSDAFSFVDSGDLKISTPMRIFADVKDSLDPNKDFVGPLMDHFLDYLGRLVDTDIQSEYIDMLTAGLDKLLGVSINKPGQMSRKVVDTVCQLGSARCLREMNVTQNTFFLEEKKCYGEIYYISTKEEWSKQFNACFDNPPTEGRQACIKRFTCPKQTKDDAIFKLILNELFIEHTRVTTESDIEYGVQVIAKKPMHISRLVEFFTFRFSNFKGISNNLKARLLKIIGPNIWKEQDRSKIQSLLDKNPDDVVRDAVNEALEISQNNLDKKPDFFQGMVEFLHPDSSSTHSSPTPSPKPTVGPTNGTSVSPNTTTTSKPNSSTQVSVSMGGALALLLLTSARWLA